MNWKIVSSFIVIILVSLYGAGYFSGISTLVIPVSKFEAHVQSFKKGDQVNPLDSFDFDTGDWEVYLYIEPADLRSLPSSIIKATCLKTKDKALLKQAQKTWHFTYTGGDMATVISTIYFFRDGKLIFESGIEINMENEGLQSAEYGWLEPKKSKALSDLVKEFKRVYWPVVIL